MFSAHDLFSIEPCPCYCFVACMRTITLCDFLSWQSGVWKTHRPPEKQGKAPRRWSLLLLLLFALNFSNRPNPTTIWESCFSATAVAMLLSILLHIGGGVSGPEGGSMNCGIDDRGVIPLNADWVSVRWGFGQVDFKNTVTRIEILYSKLYSRHLEHIPKI